MKVVSVAAMRALDNAAIAAGIPSEVLMERAGLAAAVVIHRFVTRRLGLEHRRRWLIIAGKGNNGGDAFVVARWLAEHTTDPLILFSLIAREALTGASRFHADRLPPTVPVIVERELPETILSPGTVIVDGLLGTGISGELRPPYSTLIQQINGSGLPVMALDLPSGMDGDTGRAAGPVVLADLTVTMGLPKTGLLTQEGLNQCGELRCIDLGFPLEAVAAVEGASEAFFAADATPLLSRRPHGVYKNQVGHVLVAGGSRLYPGAPVLVGQAALRAGCGLVTVAVPESIRPLLTPGLNALMFRAMADQGGGFWHPAAGAALAALLEQMDAVVFGPGLGREESAATVLETILQAGRSTVIDADGLHFLTRRGHMESVRAPVILTPHPGEMRELLAGFGLKGQLNAIRSEQAVALADKTGCHVVLKGRGTVVAEPGGRWTINTSGNGGLATAGSGDVLAGIIGSFLAQKIPAGEAARLGVFLHGLAAELAPHGLRTLGADDLPNLLGRAFQELTPFP